MPAAVPIIISLAATYLGTVGTIAVALAIGAYQARRAQKKARDAFNDSLQDRNITIRSAISPRQYVLGQARTGGTLVYAESLGPKKEFLDTVTAFAANKCDLVAYYLGDEFVLPGGMLDKKYGKASLEDITESKNVTTSNGTATLELVLAPYSDTTFQSQGPFGISFYVPLPANSTVAVAQQGSVKFPLTVVSVTGNTVVVSGVPSGASVVTVTYKSRRYQAISILYAEGDPNQSALRFAQGGSNGSVNFNVKWTDNHRLRGVAHSRVAFGYDEDAYFSGAPSIGAVLRGGHVDGAPFVDTRNGTNPAYTDNPALLAYWFMTLPRTKGGCGIPASWIDTASVNTAANICDELITVKKLDNSGTEQIKRYQCHTIISTDVPPLQNLDVILSSMAGKKVFTAGKYKIFAGAFRSAIVTLTDSDVAGDRPITADPSGSDDTPPNVVTASFIDAAKDYAQTSPNPIRNTTLIASDGYEEPMDIALPATTDARQANYLMGIALQSARPAYTISLSVGGIGENLALGDCVQLNLVNRPSYAGRTLEIVGYTDNWDGTFQLVLSEIKASTWALDLNTFTPINQGVKEDLSYLWRVMPLVNFDATPLSVQTLRDGSTLARVRISWAPITDPFVLTSGKVELRYRDALDTTAQYITVATAQPGDTSVTIDANLVDGNVYLFEGRIVNGVGAASYWVIDYQLFSGNRVDTKYVSTGNCRATDLSFRKNGGADSFDSSVYSIDGYTTCHLQFKLGANSFAVGLSTSPSVDNGFSIGFAWVVNGDSGADMYENGVLAALGAGVSSANELAITYDGANLRYYIDRIVRRTVPLIGAKLYLDSSFQKPGSSINSIRFGPGPDFEDLMIGTRELTASAATDAYSAVRTGSGLNVSSGGGGFGTTIVLAEPAFVLVTGVAFPSGVVELYAFANAERNVNHGSFTSTQLPDPSYIVTGYFSLPAGTHTVGLGGRSGPDSGGGLTVGRINGNFRAEVIKR
jgi:hypothetical protein